MSESTRTPNDQPVRGRVYQQCWSDRDGRVGSFLYTPSTGVQHSPTFPDSAPLFAWLAAHGWRAESSSLLSEYVQDPAVLEQPHV